MMLLNYYYYALRLVNEGVCCVHKYNKIHIHATSIFMSIISQASVL